MEFDRRDDQLDELVICISPGINGRWDVSEKGFEQPFASFDDKEDAYAYARDLTRSRKDATVLVEDEEGFSPLPLRDDAAAADQNRHARNDAA
ncbi:DUF2188 domain-containing protein [Noviherbaspirillum massiliense]|uniref:DUF2188 domain-containing protein n=1 Tax=Noviherbaspirillum massiliense TaxID=1465823 RepID=UPI00031C786B|nr:DUF2188 domain-containing protein [Noviherbaspirillum massiliense]